MIIDILKKDMLAAWKEGNLIKKTALTNMIDAIQKATITPKGRLELTDALATEALIKHQKIVQEELEGYPECDKYAETRSKVAQELEYVKQYTPQKIVDKDEILNLIQSFCKENQIEISQLTKAQIMPYLKSSFCDMKIAQIVLKELNL